MAGRRSHSSSRERGVLAEQEAPPEEQRIEDAVVEDASYEERLLAEEAIKDKLPSEVVRIGRHLERHQAEFTAAIYTFQGDVSQIKSMIAQLSIDLSGFRRKRPPPPLFQQPPPPPP